ncbi:TerD family protein [Streptomyces roseirectus]|uniref:TerD family protein n=1 Tax=Streptomyces roseirectus TaxID=2768066 RepID=A0A7H0I5N1_9ACTN|nr:TerD family protein [Streptomyces roseirectus]QNP68097.1 TerD family protein [Streptomyces roseirectus]
MSSNTGLKKVEIRLKWDPSPLKQPPHHLDIVAATYAADAPYGRPVYVVHYDSRSPDGTINMSRHSTTGQGFGYVEAMTVELDRLAPSFARVVVGVVIHQNTGPKTFGDLTGTGVLVLDGYTELLKDDLTRLAGSCACVVAEFTKNPSGTWEFRPSLAGSDSEPAEFMREMGAAPQP